MLLKTLTKSIREYKKASILSPIFVAFEVVLEVAIPFIMSMLVDYMQKNESNLNINTIIMYGGILLGLAILSLLFGFLAGKYCAEASTGFAKNLRKDMFYAIQDYSFTNIDKFSTSSLVTRMTTDITNVQMAYMLIIRTAIRAPLMIIFALIMSFTINTYLALIFLIMVPLIATGLILIFKKAHPIFIKVFKKYDKLNNTVQENVRGIRTVKSFVREDYETEKFKKSSNDIKEDFIVAEKILSFNNPLMNFAIYCTTLIISLLGSMVIVNSLDGTVAFKFGQLSTGQLSSLITYTTQILMALMMVSMIVVMITMSITSAERICEVLNEKSDLTNPENPIMKVKNGDIEFKNVNFSYCGSEDKLSLKNINLKLKSGQTLGIIGGTGSSKSTLVSLIPRLYDTSDGEVLVGDINVKDYDIETLRNNVAMVLQKNVLFSGTIKENLRWGNENATDEELIEAAKLAQADSFIQTFPDKYDTFIEQGGTNVSGGQKQRLCIARALLKKPKILILDDSTSAVDTKTDALIRKAMKENIPNTTKIIIAQRTSSVMDADLICVLDRGKICGLGTHEELLKTNAIYQEVYYSQNRIGGDNNEK